MGGGLRQQAVFHANRVSAYAEQPTASGRVRTALPGPGQREREGPLAFKIARNLSGFGPHPDATHQPDRRAPKTSSPPKTRRTLSPSAGATLNTRHDRGAG